MVITLTLNAAVDRAYQISGAVQPGKVMRVLTCRNTAGGKGLNVARVINLCNEDVIPTGLIGGNIGTLFEQLAQRDGLNGRFVHVNAETRLCINVLDEHRNSTEFLEPGDEITEKEMDCFMEEFEIICKDSQIVTLSGSIPRGIDSNIYYILINKIKGWGKKVILDTSGELLREGIKALPDMIKPNQEELGMLIGKQLTSIEEIKAAAIELHKTGIGQVVVSLGKDGAIMVCNQGIFHGVPPEIQAVNTVGCGDSMVGAFAVSFIRKYTPEESLKFAVAISTANALSEQTGYFEQKVLEKIYPLIRINSLTVLENGG